MDRFNSNTLQLPTDRITLGQMRRREPELFTLNAIADGACSDCDAFATRAWELILAEKAAAAALGQPDPHPNEDRQQIVNELLDEAYRSFELSSGLHETRQMASVIEKNAIQASRGGTSGRTK